jgi:predicted branched-subunit amino acid permease
MSLGLSLIHLLNFLAPALFLALALPFLEKISSKKMVSIVGFIAIAAIYFVVFSAILILGMWGLGRDSKMLTYAALLVVAASILTWRIRPY